MKTLKKILICVFILLLPLASIKDPTPMCNNLITLITRSKPLIVTATSYTVYTNETIQRRTADGSSINMKHPAINRFIAISRDLLKQFYFGQTVLVEGIGNKSGIFIIKDLMHERWKKRIDILRDPDDELITYENVKLTKLK
jgi:3D (Asp-Asp-Asp) domain-containing protein